jgi:uncharacterized protein (TIGR02246 family)
MFKRMLVALVVGAVLVLGSLPLSGRANAEAEAEIRAVFERFVSAQNAHDLQAVGEILSDSEDFLWITRGTPVWGRQAALDRFEALYEGTWSLEPKMGEFKVLELGEDSAQLFVPVTFMIAPAGQTAQPSDFLMNQTLVKTAAGWKISSILPILIPPK